MYMRYNSNPAGRRPSGNVQTRQPPHHEPERQNEPKHSRADYIPPPKPPQRTEESGFLDSILNLLPNELYNRKTKKILGLLTAEDLLLAALILLIADSDDQDSKALIFALIYIMAS